MDQFTAEQHNEVFFVRDNQAQQLGLEEEMAVALYFKTKDRPERIANMMNAEWKEFERNPE